MRGRSREARRSRQFVGGQTVGHPPKDRVKRDAGGGMAPAMRGEDLGRVDEGAVRIVRLDASNEEQFEVKQGIGQQLLGDFVRDHAANQVPGFLAPFCFANDEVQQEPAATDLLHSRADFQRVTDFTPKTAFVS